MKKYKTIVADPPWKYGKWGKASVPNYEGHVPKEITAPDCIFVGDMHLRQDIPICRTDNFQEAQWRKVAEINRYQKKYNCPVYHAGDLFNHWKPSPWLLAKAIQTLPNLFYTNYGNHDLPQHNLEQKEHAGIYVLECAGAVTVTPDGHWGDAPYIFKIKNRTIMLHHVMVWAGNVPPWPGCTDMSAAEMLQAFPEPDIIVTGHNHQTFIHKEGSRILLNPGSLTRQKSDQTNHVPCIYFYYAETNTLKEVELTYEKNVVTREHIEEKEQRDSRISAFVETLSGDWEGVVSFENVLESFIQKSKAKESVVKIIKEAL